MQDSENKFLFREKVYHEGKGEQKANQEIKSLMDHERAFKLLWNENKRNKAEIVRLEKELGEYKKKMFDLKLRLEKSKTEHQPEIQITGTLGHLKRLMHFMEIGKEYTPTDIHETLLIPHSETRMIFETIEKLKDFQVELNGNKYRRIS